MSQRSRMCSYPNHTTSGIVIALLSIAAIVFFSAIATAEATSDLEVETSTDDPQIYFDRSEDTEKVAGEKALSCHPNGTYCSGTFEDMIYRMRYQYISPGSSTSKTQVWLQSDIIDQINLMGVCTLHSNLYLVIRDDDPMQQTFTRRLDIAMAMGGEFRLGWYQGPSGYCEIWRVYQPY